MTKMSKDQIKERDGIAELLREKREALDAAIEAYNASAESLWGDIEEALGAYNETISDANSWREEVASDIQSYIDDKSEKWQEGERGQAFAEWHDIFANDEVPTADLEQPEMLVLDCEDAAEMLEQFREDLEG